MTDDSRLIGDGELTTETVVYGRIGTVGIHFVQFSLGASVKLVTTYTKFKIFGAM